MDGAKYFESKSLIFVFVLKRNLSLFLKSSQLICQNKGIAMLKLSNRNYNRGHEVNFNPNVQDASFSYAVKINSIKFADFC